MAIKVSQATIDKIKKMGMTKALAGAKSANPEMKEALTRMYGARRVAAAAPAAATPSTRRKYGTPNKTSKPVMVDAKGPNAVGKSSMSSVNPKVPGKGPAVRMAENNKNKRKGFDDPLSRLVISAGRGISAGITPDWKKKEAAMKASAAAAKRLQKNKNK